MSDTSTSRRGFGWAICLGLALAASAWGGEAPTNGFQAGVARVKITPPAPFWLSGYAARTTPAKTVLQDLWAKALAIRDPQGNQAVIVTMDLIGLPREIADEVAQRAQKQFKLDRSSLLMNCAHTHCGPAVGRNLGVMFDFDAAEQQRVGAYAESLTASLVRVIGEAMSNQAPARLSTATGSAGFAINRRARTPKGFALGLNPDGPVDHSVPVLCVNGADGQLKAALFGYACHNTTLGGDFYEIGGDYAGQAQAQFERAHPGAVAMFMILCGGDQNPNPRGTVALAQQHGKTLADEVDRVLAGPMRPIRPGVRCAVESVELDFAAHERPAFEEEVKVTDKFRQRRAKLMLADYDRGQPVRNITYPVQAVRLGEELTFLALAGEVVVDYSLRAKRQFPQENLVVAGYCHEVLCYIPSKRVLGEGGYEPVVSMIYYGLPGPFADTVEDRIFAGIGKVMAGVGVAAGTSPRPTP